MLIILKSLFSPLFQDTASALGLRISWPKTKLQNLGAGYQSPSVSVDGNAVDSVDSFVYLGSLLSSDGYCQPDINRRISLASSVMSALHNIWKDRYLFISTKICIRALIQSVLLHAAETRTLLATDIKALEAFHMKCVRDSCCRSASNSSSEMTRLQRLLACHRSRKSSATVVAPSSVTSWDCTTRRPGAQGPPLPRRLVSWSTTQRRVETPPGRPQKRWIDQVRKDNRIPPADLWRRATSRGHRGATLWPSLATW